MKFPRIFISGILCLIASWQLSAQDILLLTENFETGGPTFTLNDASFGSNTGDNLWVVNNIYDGGGVYPNTTPQSSTNGGTISYAPNSNYLHIHDQPSGILNDNYNPSNASDRFAYMTFGVCTYSIEEVHFSFFYLSEGSATAYGTIYYSLDGGPWIQFGQPMYNNMSVWQYVDITDPVFSNVGNLRFGFRWQNDAGSPPATMAFGIDDINIVGNYSETEPVTIDILSISPNPVCEGAFVTIEYQLSDTLCDGTYQIELSNGNGVFNGANGSWVTSINYPTTTGFITVQLPNSATEDDCYKFRINRLSPPPQITGTASFCFEIIECPNVINTLQPVVTLDTNAVCIGSAIDVPFTSTGLFNGSNDYIIELSDPDGTFPANPVEVGSSDDSENYDPMLGDLPGNVSGQIPVVEPGCNYFIRVISTNPDAIGSVWGPFCIAECDLTTNNGEDLYFCVSSCDVDPDGENQMIDIEVNSWDNVADYGPGNIFNTQLLSSMDFSQIGSDGILGSVAATGNTQLNVHVPCKDSLDIYGIPLGMNYMRVVATESSTPDNALGSLIRVTIGAYADEPQVITSYSYPDFIPTTTFCVGETVALFFEPYDYFANSTYMWTCNGINGGNPFVSPSGANSNSLYVIVGAPGTLNFTVQETNYGCVSPWTDPMSITVLGNPNVNISGPATVCLQDTVSFSVNFYPDTYYSWSTNAPESAIAWQDTSNNELNIVFDELGNYSFEVDVLNECGSGDDDMSINVISPPDAYAEPDSALICIGESVLLSVSTGANYEYQWLQNGVCFSTSSSYTVTPQENSVYIALVEGTAGCTSTDTVYIDIEYPDPVIQLYDSICPGGENDLTLNADTSGIYLWSTGDVTSFTTVHDVGTYTLQVDVGDICPLDYEYIILPASPDSAIMLIDSVCPGGGGNQPIQLIADQPGDYEWSTGSQQSQIMVNDTGIYVLNIYMTDSICPRTLQWTVTPDTCYAPPEMFFYVPNSFTPNGDGVNDVFGPEFSDPELIREFSMLIFDRWGEVVYESTDIYGRWTGNFRRGDYYVHDGAYVWVIEYHQESVADKVKKTGHVVMLR